MSEDVPKEIKDSLIEYAKDNGVDIQEVQKMFKKEYESDYMEGYKHEEKCQQAAFVVRAELTSGFSGNAVYDGIVFQTTPPQDKEKKDDPTKTYKFSDIYGLFRSSDEKKKDKFEVLKIRCFGDSAGMTSSLPTNTPIKISVNEDTYNDRLNLSISGEIKFTIAENASEGFNLRDFIQDNLEKPIKIEEVPYKRSKDDDDKVIIKGRVKSRKVGVSKKGNMLTKYVIYDDEQGVDEVMFINTMLTEQVWDKGALVWVVGTNNEPDQTGNGNSESIFADFVVGMLPKKVPDDQVKVMIRNAVEEFKNTVGAPVPTEVSAEPDTSGLQTVMEDNKVEPDIDLTGWD